MNYKFLLFIPIFLFSNKIQAQEGGERLFIQHCNFCHNGTVKEAPNKASLSLLSQSVIMAALETGIMKTQAATLSKKELKSIVTYLSKKNESSKSGILGKCAETIAQGNTENDVTSWGMNKENSRFLKKDVQVNKQNISKLKLKWVFDFENTSAVRTQPTISGNTIFTADQNGLIYAIDKNTACIQWTFQADAEVRSSISVGKDKNGIAEKIYFGDFKANVYAIDINTQKLLWKRKIEDHPIATLTGSLRLHEGNLYIPVSSLEVLAARDSTYPCCSFRGSIVALKASDGGLIWKSHTIDTPAAYNSANKLGPSGAPVWSSPTIDVERNLLYFGTGENYSQPTTKTSDAIIALDMTSGKIKWVQQTYENDAWNAACPDLVNCPDNYGPDYDFGAPPMLIKRKGKKDIIVAGQKSGMVFGIDPDTGAILWQTKVGRGGIMGGVHWGMASDGDQVFVPVNDHSVYKRDENKPSKAGLHSVSIDKGEILWSHLEKNRCPEGVEWQCSPGLSASITAIPGLVLGGALDGVIHAYDTENGNVLWEYDSNREFTAVSGRKCQGGSIDSAGPVVVGKQVFINSGYAKFGEKGGNVLLCFEIE